MGEAHIYQNIGMASPLNPLNGETSIIYFHTKILLVYSWFAYDFIGGLSPRKGVSASGYEPWGSKIRWRI